MITGMIIALAMQAAPAAGQPVKADAVLPVCRAIATKSTEGYSAEVLYNAAIATFEGMGYDARQQFDAMNICIGYPGGYGDALERALTKHI